MPSSLTAAAPSAEADTQRAPAPSPSPDLLGLEGMEAPVEDAGQMELGAGALQRAYGNQFVQRLATGNMLQGMLGQPSQPLGRGVAQRSAGGPATVKPGVENRIESQRGGGEPLPDVARAPMERGLGADFSSVRVHTGNEASQLNRSLGARAFTTGNDIFFSEGEYSPESQGGQKLLAHELTHVVQQGAAPSSDVGASKTPRAKLTVNAPGDAFEQEADAMAGQITEQVTPAPASTGQRSKGESGGQDDGTLSRASGAVQATPLQRVGESDEEQSSEEKEEAKRERDEEEEEAQALAEELGGDAGAPVAEVESSGEPAGSVSEAMDQAQGVVPDEELETDGASPEEATQEDKGEPALAVQASAVQASTVQPFAIQMSPLQLADDDLDADQSASEDPAADQRTPEEKAEDDREGEEAKRQGAEDGKREGEKNATDTDEEEPQVEGLPKVEDTLAGQPDLPVAPLDAGPVMEVKQAEQIELEQEESATLVPELVQGVADQNSWASVAPPNWDGEVAFNDMFTAMLTGGPGADPAQTAQASMPLGLAQLQKLPTAGTGAPGLVQRDLKSVSGETVNTAPTAAPTPGKDFVGGEWAFQDRPEYAVPVPAHQNVFAQIVVGDTAGKAAESINKFYTIGNETSPFGVMAALIEGVLMITEIVSNILSYISLALTILAALLMAFGFLISLLPFGIGLAVGNAMIAAATKLMTLVLKIAKILYDIAVARIYWRGLALALRALDLIHAIANGATAEQLRDKAKIMAGQAVGIATDAVSIALGPPASVSSLSGMGAKTAFTATGEAVGKKLLAATVTTGLKTGGTAATGNSNEIKEGVGLARDEDAVQEDAPDPTEVELPSVPEDAPMVVEGISNKLGGAAAEKLALQQRVGTMEDLLVTKQQWQQDLGVTQEELGSNKESLQASDQMLDQQMATADQFAETSGQQDGPAKEVTARSASAGGGMSENQSQMDSGLKKAEQEGGGNAPVDKTTMQGGPAKSEETGGNTQNLASDGVSAAKESKAESQAVKDESKDAQDQVEDATQVVADRRDQNASEIEMVAQDRDECLARLLEIEEQEAELIAAREAAVDYATSWAEEHQQKRESEAEPALAASGASAE